MFSVLYFTNSSATRVDIFLYPHIYPLRFVSVPTFLLTFMLSHIPIYIQKDATLHSLFYLETALHVSGDISTHHQERKQLYLQHLVFVRPLLLPAASGR
jgi:hypothetical protein